MESWLVPLNFAHHFVIYWFLQNGANKNQHHESHQRETMHDNLFVCLFVLFCFVFFFCKIDKAKQKKKCVHLCKWDMCQMNFCVFSLVTRNCERYVIMAFFFSNECHVETCFPKMKTIIFWEENYVSFTKKTHFWMWQLHPKTRSTNSSKQWTHYSALNYLLIG